jgi:long-chain fatty acid transport protein
MFRNCASTLAALGLLLLASSTRASGFDATRIGGEFGHAAAPNSFAVYHNPAALSETRKVHLTGDFTLALRSAEYVRSASTVPEPDGAEGANIGTAKLRNVLAAPSLAGSVRLGDFAAGIGFFAPMSGVVKWGGNEKFTGNTMYVGAQDGVARWHMIEGDLQVLYASAAASYTFRPLRLSVGAGANFVYTRVRVLRARTTPGHDDVRGEGRVDLDVDGISGSFSLGALWEILVDRLWFGLSYQAPPGLYDGMRLSGDLRAFVASAAEQNVELHQALPDIVRWAFRYRGASYELRLFGDYTRWSVTERQCVVLEGEQCTINRDGSQPSGGAPIPANQPRRWHDAFGVRVGGSYWLTPDWEAFLGLGYDGNAIPDGHLEPSMFDGHDLSVALGGRIALGSRLSLSLSYTHVQMLSRHVDNSKLDAYELPSRLPTANGDYRQRAGLFNSMLELYFD